MRNNPLLHINPNVFPTFLAVAEHKSFTVAADVLYKTQSNVSRQISEFEKQLGILLFNRTNKNVELTDAGHMFIELVKVHIESLNTMYERARNEREGHQGRVRIAMPPGCLLSSHFATILDKRKDFPELYISVEFISNSCVFDLVLGSQADFGFVTERINNPMLHYEPFCQEEYVLVGSPDYIADFTPEKILEKNFVSYPGMSDYFEYWIGLFLPDDKYTKARSLSYSGEINVIEGAITMVKKGVGLSVFPRHCVSQYLESNELVEYKMEPFKVLTNWIYIVRLRSDCLPQRVSTVINWFLDLYNID